MARSAGGGPSRESFYGTWKTEELPDGDNVLIITAKTYQDEGSSDAEEEQPIKSWTATTWSDWRRSIIDADERDNIIAEFPRGFQIVWGNDYSSAVFINSDGDICLHHGFKYTKICPSCGKDVSPGAKFCSGCKASLQPTAPPAASPAPSGGPACPTCGKTVEPGKKFCNGCGTKLETQGAPQTAPPCASCGQPFEAGHVFCPKCGTKRETERACASCGQKLEAGHGFCPKCGTKA